MSRSHTSERRNPTKPTELKHHEDREFVTTSVNEAVMYVIAVGLVVGLGLLLYSGIEQTVAFFRQMIGP